MGGKSEPIPFSNAICDGYYGNVVQAGVIHDGVHFHQGTRDAPSDLQNPVIVRVRRGPGSTLADLVVDADPPKAMAPSGTLYVVTLQARTARAVVLHAARVVVLSRRHPRPACLIPRLGQTIVPRYFKTELDVDPPRLNAEGEDFPFTISATDVEQFRFEAVVRTDEVRWQIELDWECAEYDGTLVINDNGRPFEAYPIAALYSGHDPSPLHSGCGFIGHQPGCPALRLESEQTQPSQMPARPRPFEAPARIPAGDAGPAARQDGPWAGGSGDLYRAVLALDAAMRVTDPDGPGSWDDYRRLVPQVRTLLSRPDFTSYESERFRALLVRVVRFFYLSEQHQLGVNIARPIHRDWAAALGEDHRDTLAMANRLAGCLFGGGRSEEARTLWEDILPRLRRTLGEAHPDTRNVAGNLAATLKSVGEPEAARDLMEETLRLNREALGHDHPVTLRAAGNLAISMYDARDYEGARALREDTLLRYRRTLGEDHPDTLQEAAALAFSLDGLGEHEAARALDEDTWQRRLRVLGENHPKTRASQERCRRERPTDQEA